MYQQIRRTDLKENEWQSVRSRVRTRLENPWISGVRFQGLEGTWNWFSVLDFLLNVKRLQGNEKTAKISDIFSSSASITTTQQTGNRWFGVNFMKKSPWNSRRVLERPKKSPWIFSLKKCTNPEGEFLINCKLLHTKGYTEVMQFVKCSSR